MHNQCHRLYHFISTGNGIVYKVSFSPKWVGPQTRLHKNFRPKISFWGGINNSGPPRKFQMMWKNSHFYTLKAKSQFLGISRLQTGSYHIAGTFEGESFRGSVRKDHFAEKTFAKCDHRWVRHTLNFVEKTFVGAANLWNSWMFSPSKVLANLKIVRGDAEYNFLKLHVQIISPTGRECVWLPTNCIVPVFLVGNECHNCQLLAARGGYRIPGKGGL